MTTLVRQGPATGHPPQRAAPSSPRTSHASVVLRRVAPTLLLAAVLAWSWLRAVGGGNALVNTGGLSLLGELLGDAAHPALSADFLARVARAVVTTVVFAALGTAGALVIGALGGLVLSDVAWSSRPPAAVRAVRLALRGVLVALRSVHELVAALLLVSALGLDPLVAVLAIALPFGAQSAKVFSEILDDVDDAPLRALRAAGAPRSAALAYALIPGAAPLLISYGFYRFECSIRSAVLLGVVGVGGLGQELVLSLSSRNWQEVWTLIGATLALSALVDAWSVKVRADMAVTSCSDWSGGQKAATRGSTTSRWVLGSAIAAPVVVVLAWFASGISLAGLVSARTRQLTASLVTDMLPPAAPPGGWSVLGRSVLDTVAMAVLAITLAVAITLLIGPWATRPRPSAAQEHASRRSRAPRLVLAVLARAVLLVLRSIPPTVWAVLALLALFPGILPGAVALGLYTGGILARLVAEGWESVDARPRDALHAAGVPGPVAALAAIAPPSGRSLISYTLYRFEICMRDTAVVGVVGAAGLGRLLQENLAIFRYPVVTTVLLATLALSIATEVLGRRVRAGMRR